MEKDNPMAAVTVRLPDGSTKEFDAGTTALQFAECATAGADIVCVTPAMLRALVVHPLSDKGVDRFLSDLAKRPKSRASS